MPALIAAPWLGTAIAGLAGSTAAVIGAHESSSASENAANLTSAATTHAADLQSQSSAQALAFSKQQAESDYQNQEIARKANYAIDAAHQGRLSTLGQMIGQAPRDIPAYVPSQDPAFTSAAGGTNATPQAGAPASGNPTDPANIQAQLTSVYKSLGVAPTGRGTGPTDLAYYADQVAKTGGWTPQNAGYWTSRIASDLKGGGGAAAPTAASQPATIGQAVPYLSAPMSPGVTMPRTVGQVLS